MTNTQKKIQKSSKVLSLVFLFVLCSCIIQGLEALLNLVFLLLNQPDAWESFSPSFPYADYSDVCLFYGCRTLMWVCYITAFALLYLMFRDISREYTPFRQIHVQRMRWAAGMLFGTYGFETILGGMKRAWIQGGQGFPFRLDPFLVPLALIGLSFILDYACQLQNEADTTL